MPIKRQYFTLIASLPPLRRFDRAERLPITRERLRERLRMLDPEDAEVLERAVAFLAWQRHPAARTDREMVAYYVQLCEVVHQPVLREMFEFPINLRTIMAALRRRFEGQPPPKPWEPWGAGHWVRHIERHWEYPDFKLAAIYPWIPKVRAHLEAGEALALERLVLNLRWDHLDRLAPATAFGFETVMAYLFKWDILQRWLVYDVSASRVRFEDLVNGVIDAYGRIFD